MRREGNVALRLLDGPLVALSRRISRAALCISRSRRLLERLTRRRLMHWSAALGRRCRALTVATVAMLISVCRQTLESDKNEERRHCE